MSCIMICLYLNDMSIFIYPLSIKYYTLVFSALYIILTLLYT